MPRHVEAMVALSSAGRGHMGRMWGIVLEGSINVTHEDGTLENGECR